MADVTLEYCILNIAASPHPQGAYELLFERAALQQVNYWGSHFATISKPTLIEDGFLQGRLVLWVEIDKKEPAVFTDILDEVSFNDLNIEIPENVGFNSRIFYYTFRKRDHMLFVEVKNELGKKVSVSQVKKIFSLLFGEEIQGADSPFVEVTIIPEEDALNKILKLSNIRWLKIHILRPNPDEIYGYVEEILGEMVQQGARSQDITFVAAPKTDGIKPNERTRQQAAVAEVNGYVQAHGRAPDGETIQLSTQWYPKTIRTSIFEFGSFIERALQIAKESVIRIRRNGDL
jgi:hypothetical protein